MNIIVLIFGFLILVLSASILVKPAVLFDLMGRYSQSAMLQVLAVVVRLILGIALIFAAPESRFPTVILVLGWLIIAVAVAFSLMGRTRFRVLVDWALRLANRFGRLSGLLGVLFGGFIIYAVL